MHANEKVQEIKQLLQLDIYSQRQIASMVGVSRVTVSLVSIGKRDEIFGELDGDGDGDSDQNTVNDGLPQRCGECGAIVYMPCRACRMRRARIGQQLKKAS